MNLYKNKKADKVDAIKMDDYKENQFDAVLCNWFLLYLNEDKRYESLENMVRVTKPGGEIRVYGQNEISLDKLNYKLKEKSIEKMVKSKVDENEIKNIPGAPSETYYYNLQIQEPSLADNFIKYLKE